MAKCKRRHGKGILSILAFAARSKVYDHSNIKISKIPKQIIQRLPIALAQVKAGNKSENLLNEIREIMYSMHRAREITKKVYNNLMNSIKL